MVLVVDLLRYWLHRAAHQTDTLWRLHAVHHSVRQLYWLNTARFHPVEKLLQMSLDSLPFLLMAVDPRVLALYYLAYATNGFIQHCNIDLRYGMLNYVVGSAETHRWHHSQTPREANNELRQHPHRLGSRLRHLVSASRSQGDRARAARPELPTLVPATDGRAFLQVVLCAASCCPPPCSSTGSATGEPSNSWPRNRTAAQRDVLLTILSANRNTTFGTQHGFHEIRAHRDYRERVPVQEYEQLRPYIDEQRLTGTPALTEESPVFYAQTSGSTGAPKYIPVTPATLSDQRSEQALFSYLQYRVRPQAFRGKALGIMGAAVEDHLESGHPVGSVSGYLYSSLPQAVRSRFVVPSEVFGIADYSLKYRAILQLALAQPNITYMGSPNPSTFLRLLDILNERRDLLLRNLATGAMEGLEELDATTRQLLSARMIADPDRAASLQRRSSLSFADVWPDISLVTTWMGGSCGMAVSKLRKALPRDTAIMELGYQATECRGTIALDVEDPGRHPAAAPRFLRVRRTAALG